MSRKIPLEVTLGGAYGFLFSDLISILGIAWFPILVFGGLAAAAVWYGAFALPLPPLKFQPGHPDFAFAAALLRITFPVVICAVLFGVMLVTGFTSRALGRRDGTTYFYFDLGASFWRMFAAYFLAGAGLVILRILVQVVARAWHHFVDPALPTGIAVTVDVLGVLALAFLFIYVFVRLIFLLPAVVVAEEQIGLGRAWSLGGGNFWRAFLSLVAVLLPAFVVFAFLYGVLFLTALHGFPRPPFVVQDHPPVRELVDYVNKVIPFVMNFLRANWPLLLVLQIAYAIARTALFAGASANAYLGVVSEDKAQPA